MAALVSAVKKLRAALGLTQPAFARRIGVSIRAIANYEKDREPKGEILQRLASLAARHNFNDLAKVFADAFAAEVAALAVAGTAEETAYTRAILFLLRNRSSLPEWKQLSDQIVTTLESLAKNHDGADGAKIEEALVELRYYAAPNAEKKIEEAARSRSKKTGEAFEQAYARILLERPDLYEEYLEDRAAAANGTRFEGSMARGPGGAAYTMRREKANDRLYRQVHDERQQQTALALPDLYRERRGWSEEVYHPRGIRKAG